jgi:hypothetical protein
MREEETSPNFERRQLILKRGRTLVSRDVTIEGEGRIDGNAEERRVVMHRRL